MFKWDQVRLLYLANLLSSVYFYATLLDLVKTKWLYSILAVVVLVGLTYVISLGLRPHPISKIDLSRFESAEIAGNAIRQSLMPEITENRVVLIGFDDRNPFELAMVKTLLTSLKDSPSEYPDLLIDAPLNKATWEGLGFRLSQFSLNKEFDRLSEGLKKAQDLRRRIAILVPPEQASHYLEHSVAKKFAQKEVLSLNLLLTHFPRSREEERDIQFPCDVAEHDQDGHGALGCLITQKARSLYRKTIPPGTLGFLDQIGETDFVFGLHQ